MAAVAFDPLEYTRALKASAVPREQAEVHARAMTAMFLHNLDALVNQDYLEARLGEMEARLDLKMDKRFAALGLKFAMVKVLLGVILAAVTVPVIPTLSIWLGPRG